MLPSQYSCMFYIVDGNGNVTVKFGVLFNDDKCANMFEALVGTLRAAKRKKVRKISIGHNILRFSHIKEFEV